MNKKIIIAAGVTIILIFIIYSIFNLIKIREIEKERENDLNKLNTYIIDPEIEDKFYSNLGIFIKAYRVGLDLSDKNTQRIIIGSDEYDFRSLPIMIILEENVEVDQNWLEKNVKMGWQDDERITARIHVEKLEDLARQNWVRYIFLAQKPSIETY